MRARWKSARPHLRAWGELAGLWAMAIAHPMFQNMTAGPEALTFIGARAADIVGVGLTVLVIPPTLLLAVESGVRRFFGARPARYTHAVMLGGLVATIGRQAVSEDGSTPEILAVVAVLACGIAGTWLYTRYRFAQAMAGILSLAPPVILFAFLTSYPVNYEIDPKPMRAESVMPMDEPPVVLVAFDEWPLSAVTRAPAALDREIFPNIARLTDDFTWYPNAVTDARITLKAMPAIMTGRHPPDESPVVPPSRAGYPENVCTVLQAGGFEAVSREQFTNFCGVKYSLGTRLTGLMRRGTRPHVSPGGVVSVLTDSVARLYPQPAIWEGRGRRLADFAREAIAERGHFAYMHTLLPHHPWYLTPAGQRLSLPSGQEWVSVEGQATWLDQPPRVDHAYQRMLLQIGFVDRMLGRLVGRLKESGAWKESLVILVADHGANVEPAVSRRGLTIDTAAAIGSIPLFVKLPGQLQGGIDRAWVSNLDVAPTIYRALGIDADFELDGAPLQDEREPPEEITIGSGFTNIRLEVEEFERRRMVQLQRRNRLFGAGTVYALGGRPRLLGRSIDQLPDAQALRYSFVDGSDGPIADLYGQPRMNAAIFDVELESGPKDPPAAVAIAYGGEILATARVFIDARDRRRVISVLPSSVRRRSSEVPVRLLSVG